MKIRKVYDFEKNNVSKLLLDEISFQKIFFDKAYSRGSHYHGNSNNIWMEVFTDFNMKKLGFENIFRLENGFYPNR